MGAGGDMPVGVPWDRQLRWGRLSILYCLCLCLVGDCPSGGAGGAHGVPGQAGEAEGAMARRDGGDTQCQGVHGPWHAGQRRGLRAPPRLPGAPTPSTQPRNHPDWGSCSPALCFGAAAEAAGRLSKSPSSSLLQRCRELLPHTSAVAHRPQYGCRGGFSAGS